MPEVEDIIIMCHWGAYIFEDVQLVGFMYLVFSRMLGESYCRHTSGRVYVPYTYSSYSGVSGLRVTSV